MDKIEEYKKMKECRKLAILLDTTNYDLMKIYNFLNIDDEYWNQKVEITYVQFMEKNVGLSRVELSRLCRARNKIVKDYEFYLAKEYVMISNLLTCMDDLNFKEINIDLYEETKQYFNELKNQILEECVNRFSYLCRDLIREGKIISDQENTAIERYMKINYFVYLEKTK